MGQIFAHIVPTIFDNKIVGIDPNKVPSSELDDLKITLESKFKKSISFKKSCVFLCVKPYHVNEVAEELKGKLDDDSMLISIVAGQSIENLAKKFKFKGSILRVMPNVAAQVGYSATAIACSDHTSKDQKKWAEKFFEHVGTVDWLDEYLMDAVTGLSGSGPAYILMVIEALIDGGVKMGLPRNIATTLATQTVRGAAQLHIESGLHPAVLKDQVTTPAGTTIEALHELERRGLRAMLIQAVEMATKKSKKLSKK